VRPRSSRRGLVITIVGGHADLVHQRPCEAGVAGRGQPRDDRGDKPHAVHAVIVAPVPLETPLRRVAAVIYDGGQRQHRVWIAAAVDVVGVAQRGALRGVSAGVGCKVSAYSEEQCDAGVGCSGFSVNPTPHGTGARQEFATRGAAGCGAPESNKILAVLFLRAE
jgi:hypothetical protein